jgi:hypothetical protein
MHLTRRNRRRILAAVLPLLVGVWSVLPWHPCQEVVAASQPAVAVEEDCGHCPDAEPRAVDLLCVDVDQHTVDGRIALPDLGPAAPLSIESARFHAALAGASFSDDGAPPPPLRHLYLRKAVLLI